MIGWYDSKFGKIPFKDVLFVEFSFEGLNNSLETAFMQYKMLLNDEILQIHLEPSTQKGRMIIASTSNPEMLLRKFGVKYSIEERKTIPYEQVIAANNQFE